MKKIVVNFFIIMAVTAIMTGCATPVTGSTNSNSSSSVVVEGRTIHNNGDEGILVFESATKLADPEAMMFGSVGVDSGLFLTLSRATRYVYVKSGSVVEEIEVLANKSGFNGFVEAKEVSSGDDAEGICLKQQGDLLYYKATPRSTIKYSFTNTIVENIGSSVLLKEVGNIQIPTGYEFVVFSIWNPGSDAASDPVDAFCFFSLTGEQQKQQQDLPPRSSGKHFYIDPSFAGWECKITFEDFDNYSETVVIGSEGLVEIEILNQPKISISLVSPSGTWCDASGVAGSWSQSSGWCENQVTLISYQNGGMIPNGREVTWTLR